MLCTHNSICLSLQVDQVTQALIETQAAKAQLERRVAELEQVGRSGSGCRVTVTSSCAHWCGAGAGGVLCFCPPFFVASVTNARSNPSIA